MALIFVIICLIIPYFYHICIPNALAIPWLLLFVLIFVVKIPLNGLAWPLVLEIYRNLSYDSRNLLLWSLLLMRFRLLCPLDWWFLCWFAYFLPLFGLLFCSFDSFFCSLFPFIVRWLFIFSFCSFSPTFIFLFILLIRLRSCYLLYFWSYNNYFDRNKEG